MAKEKQSVAEIVEEVNHERSTVHCNLRFYSQGCEVPPDALKEIKGGRLRGMSDVNPMWRMKRMTEIFGPVGFGWKYTIDRFWTETYGEEVKCFCQVSLFIRDPETKEWSDAIPGTGGSAIVKKEKGMNYVDDEGYKMALTDALSIAMKPIGIGGNIWYGSKAKGHNESKYEAYTRDTQDSPQGGQSGQRQGGASMAYTGAQLQQALSELAAITTEQEFGILWNKWCSNVPALCQNGTEFYNRACERLSIIRNSNPAK